MIELLSMLLVGAVFIYLLVGAFLLWIVFWAPLPPESQASREKLLETLHDSTLTSIGPKLHGFVFLLIVIGWGYIIYELIRDARNGN